MKNAHRLEQLLLPLEPSIIENLSKKEQAAILNALTNLVLSSLNQQINGASDEL